jgi:peroxiredoxin family protein
MNEFQKKNEKLSLIVFSGDFDKAIAAFTLATGAAAVNKEVCMFFTFWGLNIIKKREKKTFGKSILARMFNFLMGGFNNLPLSRLNFMGISPKLMSGMMKSHNVATLEELVQAAKQLNVKLIACEMAMNILEIKKEDLVDEIEDVVGVATFLEKSKDAMTLFI